MVVPKRVGDRIRSGLRKFRKVLADAKRADRSEADTSTIVTDMLAEVFGYDKYSEITGEYQIRGTYCDLAVKVEGQIAYLIEVKAIDHDLRERHLRQSTDYAAKEGIDWVVLTNGVEWTVRKMVFQQPVRDEEVFRMNLLDDDPETVVEQVYALSREGVSKRLLAEYHQEQQASDRYVVAGVIVEKAGLLLIRRELRRMFPNVRVETAEIRRVLMNEVLKRDILESDKFDSAVRRVKRATKRRLRKAQKDSDAAEDVDEPEAGDPK